jgi:glycosyltransferase involved in cell wall biosynthesis
MTLQNSAAPKPLRVLHIIDKLGTSGSSIHGVTMALAWWIPRFDSDCFQFTVCSLRKPEAAGQTLEQAGVHPRYLSRGRFDPGTLFDLLALVRLERPHVLHLHGFGACNFGRLVSLLTGVPNIVHEHIVIPRQPLYQTAADLLLAPAVTKAIAISPQVHEYMVKQRRINPARIITLFYGLPFEEFVAPDPQTLQAAREALGIAGQEQVVTMVGRLDTQKGQIYFIRAASLILRELPDTRFLIVGDGPDLDMLQEAARREGVAGRVIFTGFRRDIPVLLSLTNVFAIPSLREGGPITLFEALSARRPVVATPTGLIPEVIRDGENGFLVPISDEHALAQRVLTLLRDPELAHTMGARGWEIGRRYDVRYAVQRLGELYRELAANCPPYSITN